MALMMMIIIVAIIKYRLDEGGRHPPTQQQLLLLLRACPESGRDFGSTCKVHPESGRKWPRPRTQGHFRVYLQVDPKSNSQSCSRRIVTSTKSLFLSTCRMPAVASPPDPAAPGPLPLPLRSTDYGRPDAADYGL
jgi:hypothetical protein